MTNSAASGDVVLRFTILGCGSSGGVPRFGGADGTGDWGACDPTEPKNRRTRCSLLVQRGHSQTGFSEPNRVTSILVDTSPDMRAQLLVARCARLDGVLFTHEHADQCHGIDDLRVFAISMQKRMPVYIDENTAGGLLKRFDYCFEQRPGSLYPAILDNIKMPEYGENFFIDGPSGPIPVLAFLQHHGGVNSLGFRFGDVAYSSDVVGFPEESHQSMQGLECWIVDALQYKPHKTHAHLDMTLGWIEEFLPQKAILTNLHISMDYQSLIQRLPKNVAPAYDGMQFEANLAHN